MVGGVGCVELTGVADIGDNKKKRYGIVGRIRKSAKWYCLVAKGTSLSRMLLVLIPTSL